VTDTFLFNAKDHSVVARFQVTFDLSRRTISRAGYQAPGSSASSNGPLRRRSVQKTNAVIQSRNALSRPPPPLLRLRPRPLRRPAIPHVLGETCAACSGQPATLIGFPHCRPTSFLSNGSGVPGRMPCGCGACRCVGCTPFRNTNQLESVKRPVDCCFLLFQLLNDGLNALHITIVSGWTEQFFVSRHDKVRASTIRLSAGASFTASSVTCV